MNLHHGTQGKGKGREENNEKWVDTRTLSFHPRKGEAQRRLMLEALQLLKGHGD